MTVLSGIIFILLEINFQLVFCKNILEKPFEVANNQSEEYQLIFAQIVSGYVVLYCILFENIWK